MALVYKDRVQEVSTAAFGGTGDVQLNGVPTTPTGRQTFVATVTDSKKCAFLIDDGAGNWEISEGTVTDGSPDTITRTTVLASSAGGAKVNFAAGQKDIILMLSADKALYVDDDGRVGIGTTVPDSKLHIFNGSAGAMTVDPNGNELVLESNGVTGMSIWAGDGTAKQIIFGSPTDNNHGIIDAHYNSGSPYIRFLSPTEIMRITNSGLVGINTTSNANMTVGLVIRQSANDDEIMAWGSTDIAHGVTDEAETDIFGTIKKFTPTTGGLWIHGFSEDEQGITFRSIYTNDNTTKSAAGNAAVEIQAQKKSGTSVASPGADANLFGVNSGTGTLRFIVDQEGDIHADGGASTAAVTVYDTEDDLGLCRALTLAVGGKGVIEDARDRFIRYHAQDLVDIGILGALPGDRPLYCVTRLQWLHHGAIGQLGTNQQDVIEALTAVVPEFATELAAARAGRMLPNQEKPHG